MTAVTPLDGLRVLDLSTVIAGPNCARYLADFGADVIKVERPGGGDSLRDMAWRDPRDGAGLWWKLVNRNKWTIALDLKDAADRDVLLGLVDGADVLIENFRPGHARAARARARRAARSLPLARRDQSERVRSGRAVRGQGGVRDDRGGDERLRRDQRSARWATAPPADRADRRGDRSGGGVRHDGRAAFRRRPGGRRQPAREHVPDHGTTRVAVPGDGSAAASARRRAAVHGAEGDVSMCGREVGRCLDVGRHRRGSCVAPPGRRRRRSLRHVRRADGEPGGARGDHGDVVRAAHRRPR